MLSRFLPDRTRERLTEERTWLTRLQQALERFDTSADDRAALRRSIEQLDRLFLLVVIGEFNAGKSAFVNALVGARVLEEGVTPTTTRLQILQYGDTPERRTDASGADVIAAPVPFLRDLNIVDTPGTNAIFREHERLTSEFVPQADLVLFVTSADRPFTESERSSCRRSRTGAKRSSPSSTRSTCSNGRRTRTGPRVRRRARAGALRQRAGDLSGVGAPRASDEDGRAGGPADRRRSLRRDGALHQRDPRREGAARAQAAESARHRPAAGRDDERDHRARQDVLREDRRPSTTSKRSWTSIAPICRASSSSGWPKSTTSCSSSRTAASPSSTRRCASAAFRISSTRRASSANSSATVVADTPQQIEKRVHDVIDWMVASELRQWQAVTAHVNRRGRRTPAALSAAIRAAFQYDRDKLINTVGRAATDRRRPLRSREREAAAMADGVRAAVAGAALAQAGAVGLGAVVTAARHDDRGGRHRHPRRRHDCRARHVRHPVEARAREGPAPRPHRDDARPS